MLPACRYPKRKSADKLLWNRVGQPRRSASMRTCSARAYRRDSLYKLKSSCSRTLINKCRSLRCIQVLGRTHRNMHDDGCRSSIVPRPVIDEVYPILAHLPSGPCSVGPSRGAKGRRQGPQNVSPRSGWCLVLVLSQTRHISATTQRLDVRKATCHDPDSTASSCRFAIPVPKYGTFIRN